MIYLKYVITFKANSIISKKVFKSRKFKDIVKKYYVCYTTLQSGLPRDLSSEVHLICSSSTLALAIRSQARSVRYGHPVAVDNYPCYSHFISSIANQALDDSKELEGKGC